MSTRENGSCGIAYRPIENARERQTLLLRDFDPVPCLHTKSTRVERARFPVFDVHSHVNDAMGLHTQLPVERVLEIMDRTNVRELVILTGLWGAPLRKVIAEMIRPHPGRFRVFTQLDWARFSEPGFVPGMIDQLREGVALGACGLKILKDFGLESRDAGGTLIRIDDERLDPIWEECGRLGIPVGIHTSDPEAFFLPVDGRNERYEELIANPGWHFGDVSRFPAKRELLAARDRVFARHPGTRFFAFHFANWPENLAYVDELLGRHPNVHIEFGARVAELGRQPYAARDFFLKHQDRIMFGSDNELEEEMYRSHFRWLESRDEYFDYWGAPAQGRWKIYGLGLPDEVLRKVYHLNADRLFPGRQRSANG